MSKIVSNYFKSIIKRQKKLLFLYTIIGFVAFPMVALISTDYDQGRSIYEFSILINAIFMVGCVMVLPIIINKFSLNKRSVDTYYALPISRQHLFDVHYLAGVVCIYIPLLINYVLGVLILTLRYGSHFFTGTYFLAFLGISIITLAIYSINTLIVTKANNMVDAAILIAAYTILPYMLIACAMSLFNRFTIGFTESMFNLSSLFDFLCPLTVLNNFINAVNNYTYRFAGFEYNILWLVYEGAIAIGFYVWAAQVFKKRKGEDSEQVSKDFFTYPFVVNLTSIILLSFYIIDFSDIVLTIAILVLTFIVYLVMHFISRRSMKVTSALIIKYFVILFSFNVFAFAAKETYFFGINLRTPDINQYAQLEVSYWDYTNESKDYHAEISLKDMNKNEEAFVNDILALQTKAAEFKRNHSGYSYSYEDSVYLTIEFLPNDKDEIKWFRFDLPREDYGDLLKNKLFKVLNSYEDTEVVY